MGLSDNHPHIGGRKTAQIRKGQLGAIASAVIAEAGTGYTVGDLEYVGDSSTQLSFLGIDSVGGSGEATEVNIIIGGNNYRLGATYSTSTHSGTGAGTGLTIRITAIM